MRFRSILSYLGVLLELLGVLMLIPIIVSFAYQEGVYIPFLFGAVISFISGIVLDKKFERDELNLGSAMALASITFVVISIFGSIPYLEYLTPIDSLFESISGFTTTGLTTVNPEVLPKSILFWRSFTQWIGGVGILLIFLLLLSSPGMSSYYMYRAEGRTQRLESSVYHTVKRIFIIYGIYTILGVVLLSMVGMPIFDSLLHSFTSISTGGFSPRGESIGFYKNPSIELVIIFLMVLGATSFFVHDRLFKRKFVNYIKNTETNIFWVLIAIFFVLLSLSFLSTAEPMRFGLFHTFSALTTTGYTNLNSEFPQLSKFLIIILMVCGGYAGSTAGGLKLVRVGILGKAITWVVKKISYPISAVLPFKFHNRIIREEELSIISLFTMIYIIILVLSTLIISFLGYSPIDSFFVSASAEGTVGLSTIEISLMPPLGKLVLMIGMLLGRLEILPFLVLVYALLNIRSERTFY